MRFIRLALSTGNTFRSALAWQFALLGGSLDDIDPCRGRLPRVLGSTFARNVKTETPENFRCGWFR